MTTPITAASAVAIAAIYMHGIGEDFTGGVPRLPRWQPAHTTGGWCSRWSMPEAASLSRPASASVLTAELAGSLTGKLPASERGSRVDHVHDKVRALYHTDGIYIHTLLTPSEGGESARSNGSVRAR